MQHLVEFGGGDGLDARPTREKPFEVGRDRRGGGLLQHDLAHPDPVGLGGLTRGAAPRQHPALAVVPGKQAAAERGRPDVYEGGVVGHDGCSLFKNQTKHSMCDMANGKPHPLTSPTVDLGPPRR